MPFDGWLSTGAIAQIFKSEVGARKGKIWDEYDDGSVLYLRATLRAYEEVKPGDWVRGGVALRATGEAISVGPYTLRTFCQNGAIMGGLIERGVITRASVPLADEAGLASEVRALVDRSCRPEHAAAVFNYARATLAVDLPADVARGTLMTRLFESSRQELATTMIARFMGMDDRSLFALMNVVTATARDQSDPALRWELEVLGGELAMGHAGIARKARDHDAVARERKAA